MLEGITVEAFEADVLDFLSNAQDAHFKQPYKQLTYKPMVELVHYLQANGFQVYITSGGGRDFMRAICEEVYGIPRAMTIGSSVTFKYSEDDQGAAQVLRTKEIEQPIDDGPGKPLHIHRAIGRKPIVAAGNSDGDIHMLKYAGSGLRLLVHHDDAEREYAYDGGSEKALQLAAQDGWTRRQHEERLEDRVLTPQHVKLFSRRPLTPEHPRLGAARAGDHRGADQLSLGQSDGRPTDTE